MAKNQPSLTDIYSGVWTPYGADNSGNISSVAGTGSYSKIGKVLTLSGTITNIDTTGLVATDVFHIKTAEGALPFGKAVETSVGATSHTNFTFTDTLVCKIKTSQARLRFTESASGANGRNTLVSDVSSGIADVSFTITYVLA